MTKSSIAPRSSSVVITPELAPVSARALSTTSSSTVARSRLWLMRSIAALSREMRASARPVGSRSFIAPLPPKGCAAAGRGAQWGAAAPQRRVEDSERRAKSHVLDVKLASEVTTRSQNIA